MPRWLDHLTVRPAVSLRCRPHRPDKHQDTERGAQTVEYVLVLVAVVLIVVPMVLLLLDDIAALITRIRESISQLGPSGTGL